MVFQSLNLVHGPYGIRHVFDFVFFRNVGIYFDPPTRRGVIERLVECLRPGGFLYLGQSESLDEVASFGLTRRGPAMYCKGGT